MTSRKAIQEASATVLHGIEPSAGSLHGRAVYGTPPLSLQRNKTKRVTFGRTQNAANSRATAIQVGGCTRCPHRQRKWGGHKRPCLRNPQGGQRTRQPQPSTQRRPRAGFSATGTTLPPACVGMSGGRNSGGRMERQLGSGHVSVHVSVPFVALQVSSVTMQSHIPRGSTRNPPPGIANAQHGNLALAASHFEKNGKPRRTALEKGSPLHTEEVSVELARVVKFKPLKPSLKCLKQVRLSTLSSVGYAFV